MSVAPPPPQTEPQPGQTGRPGGGKEEHVNLYWIPRLPLVSLTLAAWINLVAFLGKRCSIFSHKSLGSALARSWAVRIPAARSCRARPWDNAVQYIITGSGSQLVCPPTCFTPGISIRDTRSTLAVKVRSLVIEGKRRWRDHISGSSWRGRGRGH